MDASLELDCDAIVDDPEPGYAGLAKQLEVLKTRTVATQHECSCVLPMSLTDLRSVEVPEGEHDDVAQMAIESLREYYEDFDQRITRTWQHEETPHDMAMVSSVSVRSSIAETIVDDLKSVKLRCVGMDSLPFAMARAAELGSFSRKDEPIALLDWGHSTVTLVIARNGRPEFVRRLRDCNGRDAIESLAQGLRLDSTDILHVLATCGLPAAGAHATSNAATEKIQRLLIPELDKVCAELQKTLLYLRHHLRKLMPSQLVLFGGMATIPQISSAFQERCGLETTPWKLNSRNSHVSDAVYGVAMAASVGRNWT